LTIFDNIISVVSQILSYLAELTGLTPIGLMSILALILLLCIVGIFILIKFKRIRKILMDVNQRIIVLGQKLEQSSPKTNLKKISPYKMIFDPDQDKLNDSDEQYNDAQGEKPTIPVQNKFQRHGSQRISDTLLSKKRETTANITIEEFSEPLTSDPELKSAILKLMQGSDMPISLKYIVKNLSGKYFGGNYHLILNELEQLEKEGQIEGFSRSGKAHFIKKR